MGKPSLMAVVLIGTSGWVYPHWKGRFYPRTLPQTKWLDYYVQRFPTVEVNNSFYRLPSIKAFRDWRERTPPGFVFAVKGSRYITHLKRLRDPRPPLRLFRERAVHLKPKLGPVLFQLPPRFAVDLERLETFLRALPDSFRSVMEFRDPTWHVQAVYDLLERHRVGYCIMVAPKLKCVPLVTGGLLYVRFHSPSGAGPAFGRRRLREWARRIDGLLREAEMGYVYFNNDAQGAAIEDARLLGDLLGG